MAAQETIATMGDTSYLINDLNARVRLLEERYMQLRENFELINENMVEEQKEVLKRVKTLSEELKKSKKDVEDLALTINHIIKEVSLFARKDTLKVLEKYINMWNPMKFTTEEDVMRIVKSEIQKMPRKIDLEKKEGPRIAKRNTNK